MNIQKCLIVLVVAILMLSIVATAENGNGTNVKTEKINVLIKSLNRGIDKDSGKQIVWVNITTNKIGRMIYVEEYFSKNETGQLKLDSRRMYYNDTMKDNTLVLQIKRPMDKDGKSYAYINAMVFLNGKRVLYTSFKRLKPKNVKTTGSNDSKKSPGFDIIMPTISIISLAYILKRRRL